MDKHRAAAEAIGFIQKWKDNRAAKKAKEEAERAAYKAAIVEVDSVLVPILTKLLNEASKNASKLKVINVNTLKMDQQRQDAINAVYTVIYKTFEDNPIFDEMTKAYMSKMEEHECHASRRDADFEDGFVRVSGNCIETDWDDPAAQIYSWYLSDNALPKCANLAAASIEKIFSNRLKGVTVSKYVGDNGEWFSVDVKWPRGESD